MRKGSGVETKGREETVVGRRRNDPASLARVNGGEPVSLRGTRIFVAVESVQPVGLSSQAPRTNVTLARE